MTSPDDSNGAPSPSEEEFQDAVLDDTLNVAGKLVTLSGAELQQLLASAVAEALRMKTPYDHKEENAKPDTSSDASSSVSRSISHIAFKAPQPLFAQNPTVWFAILEQQFKLTNIKTESTKFSHAVSALDARLHDRFASFITRQDLGKCPYTEFKQEVIKILGESERTKLHKLLHGLTLGDQKPSQLLAKFREYAGSNFAENSIKQLWMDRLPQQVQMSLTPFEGDLSLTVLAERADNLIETLAKFRGINAVSDSANTLYVDHPTTSTPTTGTSVQTKTILDAIATMQEQINQLSVQNNRSRDENRSRSPNRSFRGKSRQRSPSQGELNDKGECWYHDRFADKAKKCISSCIRWKAGQQKPSPSTPDSTNN